MKRKRDLRIIPVKFLVTDEEFKILQARASSGHDVLGAQSAQSFARWMALYAPIPTIAAANTTDSKEKK